MTLRVDMVQPFWVELSNGNDVMVVSLWTVHARPHARHVVLREHGPRARTMSVVTRPNGVVQSVMFERHVVAFPRPSCVFRQWPATLAEAGRAERQSVAADDETKVVLDSANV